MAEAWCEYDTWITVTGSASKDTFHSTADCSRLHGYESVERSESYIAYHDPEPCPFCHDIDAQTGGPTGEYRTYANRGTDDEWRR